MITEGFIDLYRAYVQRGRCARAWKTEAQILARRNRELEAEVEGLERALMRAES